MITDEKTLNRLHADVNEGLFTLENTANAVFRILEIVRDTPEYLQLIPTLPAHAQEKPGAGWWQGWEANRLLDGLLYVLEMYAPEDRILVPLTNRAYRFGYAGKETGEDMLYRIECYLTLPEEYTRKEYGRTGYLYDELSGLLGTEGYVLCPEKEDRTARKGRTELRLCRNWLAGYCESTGLMPLLHLLLKGGKRFRYGSVRVLDAVLGFDEAEEYGFYNRQYAPSIHYLVFDTFRRKPHALTGDNLMEVAEGINVPTRKHPDGCEPHFPAYRFTSDAYRELVAKGYLEEYSRHWPGEAISCARPTEKELSKNLFYGTGL